MRPLNLDFQPGRAGNALGWSLLIAGLASAATALACAQYVAERAHEQQGMLGHLQHQLQSRSGPTSKLSPVEIREQEVRLAEMKQISSQLKRPWERLFLALESLRGKDIALLALTPDARKGQVRISAEARNLEAMLSFHRQLEESAELSDVSLLNHEIVAQSAQRPILFNLLATWEVGDVHP